MAETASETPKMKAKKRAYHRKPVAPAPIPVNPTVAEIENDVLGLVKQRISSNEGIINATTAVNIANSNLQIAQMRLQQIVGEVQYRMSIIAQLKGDQPTAGTYAPQLTRSEADSLGIVPSGVSSIPTPRTVQVEPRLPGERRVRTESAEGVRAEEIGSRAVI